MSNANHKPVMVEKKIYAKLMGLKGEFQAKSIKNISINEVIKRLLDFFLNEKGEDKNVEKNQ